MLESCEEFVWRLVLGDEEIHTSREHDAAAFVSSAHSDHQHVGMGLTQVPETRFQVEAGEVGVEYQDVGLVAYHAIS